MTTNSRPSAAQTTRARKTPTHLADYVGYSAQAAKPVSLAHRLQEESSSMPYPIANYVTNNKFSVSHQNFLAAISKVTEPKNYYEVVRDP